MANSCLRLALCLLAACLIAAGCSKRGDAPSPSSLPPPEPPVSVAPPAPPPPPPVEEKDPTPLVESLSGKYSFFAYRPDKESYDWRSAPAERQLSVLDMICEVGAEYGLKPKLANFDIQKGMIVLDWNGEFVDSIGDNKTAQAFFASVCATIAQNLPQAEWFQFKKDNLPFSGAGVSLGAEGAYEYPKLRIGDAAPEFYAEIRAQLPYMGMVPLEVELPASMSDKDAAMVELLVRVGDPGAELSSPKAADNAYLVTCALNNLPLLSTYFYSDDDPYYHEELLPITAAVEDDVVVLREHVEAAVRELFGDVAVRHESADGWLWHEDEGVYTPPHRGGLSYSLPVIFASVDSPDKILLELSYLGMGLGGYYNPETLEPVEEDQLSGVARSLSRRDVILTKTPDGYRFYSHRFAENEIRPTQDDSSAEESQPQKD